MTWKTLHRRYNGPKGGECGKLTMGVMGLFPQRPLSASVSGHDNGQHLFMSKGAARWPYNRRGKPGSCQHCPGIVSKSKMWAAEPAPGVGQTHPDRGEQHSEYVRGLRKQSRIGVIMSAPGFRSVCGFCSRHVRRWGSSASA